MEVVAILKELPQDVRMVCSRNVSGETVIPFTKDNLHHALDIEPSEASTSQSLMPSDRLVKAKSDGSLATTGSQGDGFSKMKSRSLEPLTGLFLVLLCFMSLRGLILHIVS